jgi:mRNA-degrading endonuclease toxin of MazEF toxin-antitoxin module
VRRGEVWWGRATLTGGSRKRRPLLVVSNDAFNRNPAYPKVMVVHLTSVMRAGGGYPWEFALAKGSAGLPGASVAKCGEIYTMLKSDLEELVGTLRNDQLEKLDGALAVALNLRLAR